MPASLSSDRPTDRMVLTIKMLLKRGSPIPTDLHARALSEGVDVQALIDKHL